MKFSRENDLVFATRTGGIHSHSSIIEYGLIPAMLKAGITKPVLDKNAKPVFDDDGRPMRAAKYTGLHCLRHFYASWCINRRKAGGLELTPKLVQARLGHATLGMTMDTYGHIFPEDDSAELAAAEQALFNPRRVE